jgi:hypothetical protein
LVRLKTESSDFFVGIFVCDRFEFGKHEYVFFQKSREGFRKMVVPSTM